MTFDLKPAGLPQSDRQSGQKRGRARFIAWQHGWVLAAALILTACNALTTSYNNAPFLLTWMANSYFDLSGDQEVLLKERLRSFRQWHRTQLPDYAKVFAEVQTRMGRHVEQGDVAWLFGETESRIRDMVDHAAPVAAELATHLNHGNLAALDKKFAKNNAEFEKDFITATPEKRREKRFEKVLAESERWYGSFSREQKKRIREFSDALPANYPLLLADRQRRQRELSGILASAVDKTAPQAEVANRLRQWVVEYERGRSPGFRDFAQRYRAESEKMFAAIANLATPEQRQVARVNVQKYMDDFSVLAVASN